MLTKEQVLDLLGVLATASMIGVGVALGGTFGATVVAGIGTSVSGTILPWGHEKLKGWLSSRHGALNHDVQLALANAFVQALTHLEEEYFKLGKWNPLSKNEKESIKAFFRTAKEQKNEIFLECRKPVSDQEVKDYLYDEATGATENLWKRLGADSVLAPCGEHFRDFLRRNLLEQVVDCFKVELKTDTKAWRAFQLLLLEGLYEDVKAVRASQDEISGYLQTLGKVKQQLDQLKDVIDQRSPTEPFQAGLEKALGALQRMEEKLDVVGGTTQRTEEKIDGIAADVKALRDAISAILPKAKEQIPKVPDDIRALFEEGLLLRDSGKYEDARSIFKKGQELAASYGHTLAIAEAKYLLAVVLDEWDRNSTAAKALLEECVEEFRGSNSPKYAAMALYRLGAIEIDAGDLDRAEAYLSQALELHQKDENKLAIANAVHQMGWVKDHRGRSTEALALYDQALVDFLSLYEEGKAGTEDEALHGIAACYHHKGLVYEREGKVEEAESNYVQALAWLRKSNFQPEIGKLLYLMGRLKYWEGQDDAGTEFLDEAMVIYGKVEDYSWYAKCLHLRGQMLFTRGHLDQAAGMFESALNAVEKTGNAKDQERYLNTLGDLYLKTGKLEDARRYFERAKDLSLREGSLDGYAASVGNLAELAHLKRDEDERNRLLSDGIDTLKKFLRSVQAEPERAFITGQIGSFYERMLDFHQALTFYQKAKKAFEALGDMRGIGRCLGSIARMKGSLGQKQEEYDTYKELKKLVDGSPYYDLIADAALSLGEIETRSGNLHEAETMFQEAELLCRKYNLPHLPRLTRSVQILRHQVSQRKPPELNLKQLVEELFEWVAWFPEAKDRILRLWMWERWDALRGNFWSTGGVKFMVCQDDVHSFLRISELLHPYSDFSLQVVSCEYPRPGIEFIPFPMDKKIFFDCAIRRKEKISEGLYTVVFLRGDKHSRYELLATTVRSEVTGNEGAVIAGLSNGLPEQAHRLILSSSAADLIGQKIFFLPYERYLAEDKLLSDMGHSKNLGLIPVYFDSLPASESCEVLGSKRVKLPRMSAEERENLRKQVRKVKRDLSQLSSISKDSAQTLLNDLTLDVGDLADDCVAGRSLDIEIYALQYPAGLDRELQAALVIKGFV